MKYGAVVFVLVGVFFGIVVFIYLDLHETEQGKANEANQNSANRDITHGFCLSDACRKDATIIRNNMDQNTEPCNDFYQFACGGYFKLNVKPDYTVNPAALTFSDYILQLQMSKNYEDKTGEYEQRHFRLAKNFFNSCMNTSRIEADGLAPLQNILKKLGGWPVLDPYERSLDQFDIAETNSKIMNAGYPSYIIPKVGVYIDTYHKIPEHTFYLSNPDSGLPSGWKYYESYDDRENSSNYKNYYNYMRDIALYLGADRRSKEKLLQHSFFFQLQLHRLVQLSKTNPEREHSFTTVGQIVRDCPRFAWKEYFASLLPSNTIITDDDVVAVHRDCNLAALYGLTESYPEYIIVTYMLWRVVDHSILYLSEQVRNRYHAIHNHPYKHEPRWKICVSEVIQSLPMSARALIVRDYFFPFSQKLAAVNITSSIKTAFKKDIEKVDWLYPSIKISIQEKIDSLLLLTPFPDELMKSAEVNLYYQDLELTGGNYLESILNVSLFKMRNIRLGFSSDKDKWKIIGIAEDITEMDPLDLNAILLSADVLQGIYFDTKRPNYMNYGGIGSVIGRKIIQGIQYWRTLKSSNNLQCIVDQYNKYSLKRFGHNTGGESKMETNIADNVGYEQSYHAYTAWAAANEPEEALPGLPYTPRQMFWITLANTFCSNLTSTAHNDYLMFHDHRNSDFRVNGPLSNSVEFSKDFNCPVGSRMNPVNKCRFM